MINGRLLFPAAIAFSLLAHAGLIIQLANRSVASSAEETEATPQVTRLVFNQAAKVMQDKPVPKPEPKPQIKQPPKQQVKPQPKIQSSKKPAPKVVEKPEPEPVEQHLPPQSSPPMAKAQPQQESLPRPPVESLFLQEDEKQRYLAKLLAHIESHKYYPGAARKRGIEGDVMVAFMLAPNGEVMDVDVKGGPRMLRVAAQKAVHTAMPLPKPPKDLAEPMPVKYKMAFVIQ